MDFLRSLNGRVTPTMNEALKEVYTTVKVELALKEMHLLKAPRPDGMPPVFFQRYWPAVGGKVTKALLSALNTGEFPMSLNHSFITLVPKKPEPIKVTDFRPMSLCNVYQLISKIIAKRLKGIPSHVISDS